MHKRGCINFSPKLVIPWDAAVNHVGRLACISCSSEISGLQFIATEGNTDIFKSVSLLKQRLKRDIINSYKQSPGE